MQQLIGQDANAGPLSEREWMYVDNRINWWLTEKITALNLLNITKVGEGKMSIEYSAFSDVGSPIFTYSFQEESLVKLDKTPTRLNLVGIRIDFEISKIELDINSNYQAQCVDAGMRKISQFIDRAVYRGADVYGLRTENVKFATKGLFNTTSVNNIAAGGSGVDADDSMVNPGDYAHTVNHLITLCAEDDLYGPYDLVMTKGCYLQAIANQSTTTGLKDLEDVLRIPAMEAIIQSGEQISPAIKRLITTPNLVGAAEANASGEMMLLDNQPDNMDLVVNYDPTRINLYGGGLTNRLTQQFAIITGLVARVRRPNAIATTTTLTNNVLSS